MIVFISWSGKTSHAVAKALADFIPSIVQAVTPWLSSQDIAKGKLWDAALAKQLEECKIGICCLTPDNLNAPWLMYEAGALSKIAGESLVCPFLFRVEPSDTTGPMTRFQATKADIVDVRKLMHTINSALGEKVLSVELIDKAFNKFWPDLQSELERIPETSTITFPVRNEKEMLSEILELTREITRAITKTPRKPTAQVSKVVDSSSPMFRAIQMMDSKEIHLLRKSILESTLDDEQLMQLLRQIDDAEEALSSMRQTDAETSP